MKILLGREEVTPDKPDNRGRTPLWYASEGGHEGVVKILLRRGEVDPNKPDNRGQTPLTAASMWGSRAVLMLLQSYNTKRKLWRYSRSS